MNRTPAWYLVFGGAFFASAAGAALQYGGMLEIGGINPNMVLIASAAGFAYLKERRWLWFAGGMCAFSILTLAWNVSWWREMTLTIAAVAAMGGAERLIRTRFYAAGFALATLGTVLYYALSALVIGAPIPREPLVLETLINSILVITLLYALKKIKRRWDCPR